MHHCTGPALPILILPQQPTATATLIQSHSPHLSYLSPSPLPVSAPTSVSLCLLCALAVRTRVRSSPPFQRRILHAPGGPAPERAERTRCPRFVCRNSPSAEDRTEQGVMWCNGVAVRGRAPGWLECGQPPGRVGSCVGWGKRWRGDGVGGTFRHSAVAAPWSRRSWATTPMEASC